MTSSPSSRHFLHIPKTGGTALKAALRGSGVVLHAHTTTMKDVPDGSAIVILRDPVDRFVSGFNAYAAMRPQGRTVEDAALDPDIEHHMPLLAPQARWFDGGRPFFILRTETLDADFERLAALLGLPEWHRLPRDGPNRNRGPDHVALSDRARQRLRDHYREDYALLASIEPPDGGFVMQGEPVPKPELVMVVPSPELRPTEYVPGVPAAGLLVPIDDPRIKAGIVVVKEPVKPVKPKKESI